MDFGKRFKQYREKAELTQKEAAKLIGIKDYQLANYETNRSQPSLEILVKMSKAYLVSIDNLLGNNMLRNKYEKEHADDSKEFVDINKVIEILKQYDDQINEGKKK